MSAQMFFLSIIHGLILGGAYGAIALGLSMIFGVSRVTNFAHGALMMISMYLYFELYNRFHLDPYIAMIIVVPIMYFIGVLMQKFLVTPLLKREAGTTQDPVSLLLITLGFSFVLENIAMMKYGANFRTIQTKAGTSYLTIGANADFVTQWAKIIFFLVAFAMAFTLWFIINRTELGKRIRAVSQNRTAAAICGVDVYKTYEIAFGLGVAATGIAGACLVQYYFVQPYVGQNFGTKAFLMVVLGGLGSLPGALLGGMIFGLVETVGSLFINSTSASMLSFLVFLIVLYVKPSGLLSKK